MRKPLPARESMNAVSWSLLRSLFGCPTPGVSVRAPAGHRN
jgi:hypothetical protein